MVGKSIKIHAKCCMHRQLYLMFGHSGKKFQEICSHLSGNKCLHTLKCLLKLDGETVYAVTTKMSKHVKLVIYLNNLTLSIGVYLSIGV